MDQGVEHEPALCAVGAEEEEIGILERQRGVHDRDVADERSVTDMAIGLASHATGNVDLVGGKTATEAANPRPGMRREKLVGIPPRGTDDAGQVARLHLIEIDGHDVTYAKACQPLINERPGPTEPDDADLSTPQELLPGCAEEESLTVVARIDACPTAARGGEQTTVVEADDG